MLSSATKPAWSRKPTSARTPLLFSSARTGKAMQRTQSSQTETTRPSACAPSLLSSACSGKAM
eukprot:2198238-Heterocapsa_arctica.AAC.1